MENISIKLTDYIAKKGIIQKEDYEIYQYGFQIFLELFISIICSIIIALVLNMKMECIIFFVFFIPLRSFGGGLHMKTYRSCLLFSCITLIGILVITKYWNLASPISFTLFLLSLLILKSVGPVNHPNRPVDSEENKKFIKKTNWTLILSFFAAILFWFINLQKYLLLESLIFFLVSITSLIGKIKYSYKE